VEDQARGGRLGPLSPRKKRRCTAPIPRVGVTVALVICYGLRGRWRHFFHAKTLARSLAV